MFAVIAVAGGAPPGTQTILLTTYLTIGLSVIAHGITAAPLAAATRAGTSPTRTSAPRWRGSQRPNSVPAVLEARRYRHDQMTLATDRTVNDMRKIQSQGVHHITLVGADRQTSIDFWEGVLGMPFVFEQPNLDNADESHLYFDPGDGRLITIFTNEERTPDPERTPTDPGCVHHLAFALSQATFAQAVERLDERGIRHSGVKDRGFMDSIYFTDPLGLLIELAVLPLRAAGRAHARRRAARGPPHPRGARRLQHRAHPPGRRDRAARHRLAGLAVRGPLAEGPLHARPAPGRGCARRVTPAGPRGERKGLGELVEEGVDPAVDVVSDRPHLLTGRPAGSVRSQST